MKPTCRMLGEGLNMYGPVFVVDVHDMLKPNIARDSSNGGSVWISQFYAPRHATKSTDVRIEKCGVNTVD